MSVGIVISVMLIGMSLRFGLHPRDPMPIHDDFALWSAKRRLASAASDKAVILLGSSRIRADLRTSEIKKRWPSCTPVDLAINGFSYQSMLSDIAADPSIRGLVLVDDTPYVDARIFPDSEKKAREWVGQYHGTFTPVTSTVHLGQFFRLFYFLQNRDYSWIRLFGLIAGEGHGSNVYSMDSNRDTYFDFSKATQAELDVERHKEYPKIITDALLLHSRFERIASDVKKIEGRGGRVVFLYLPMGTQVRDIEAQQFPLSAYFDPLTTISGAIFIDYRLHPVLAAYDPPDNLHLDMREVPRFDSDLLPIVEKCLTQHGDSRFLQWHEVTP